MQPRIDLMSTEFGPRAAKRLAGIGQLVASSPLPSATTELVQLRASQINGCAYCLDMHTKEAVAAGESHQRLHLVACWREATVFTDAERAALALAQEGTRLADAHAGVTDETWAQVREHYDDEQIAALVTTIAMINAFNRLNVIIQNPAGDYQAGMLEAAKH